LDWKFMISPGPQKEKAASVMRWRPGEHGGNPPKPRSSASPPFDGFALSSGAKNEGPYQTMA
jgi:hypothetical protein